ncbi:MAG: Ig-like domain-containing protein [Bacteroidetes bacterium]|nr:Ig-like domain-containing protein [Bacteroidota bacterium]
MKKSIPAVIVLIAAHAFAQSPDSLQEYFQSAAREFNVPAPILEAIGYTQTRWTQIRYTPQEIENRSRDMQPPLFGVMGLRDDDWFGHSLDSAAKLITLSADSLKDNACQNIRGAAALLSEYRDEANQDSQAVTGDLSSWSSVIARFSGIPQHELAFDFAYNTLQYVQMGVNENGVVIPPERIDLSGFPQSVKQQGLKSKGSPPPKGVSETMGINANTADYPGANWVGSPNYGSRSGAPIVFVIIHDTEGPFASSVSWLQNPVAQASAHYVIRSSDGYIDQLVHEKDEAWAVLCWNPITLNIEHEGYVAQPQYFTEAMYESSARLTAFMCQEYDIPEDSLHIFGHNAWTYSWFSLIPFSLYTQYVGPDYATCNDHTDPGKYWNWHHYFGLVHSYDTTRARVLSSNPAASDTAAPIYSSIAVNFSKPMELVSTDSAFHIVPVVSGTFSFNAVQTQLVFRPDNLLSPLTTYSVTIDSSAKGTNLLSIGSPYSFQFETGKTDTTGPAIVAVSPRNGGSSISKAYVEFVLNHPVQLGSVNSFISFVDSTGTAVPYSRVDYRITSDGLTLIALRSMIGLTPGMKYTVSLAPGLTDYYGVKSAKAFSTTFTCDIAEASGGTVIEGFESSLGKWLQPAASRETYGVDSSAAKFSVAYMPYDGFGSGRLDYEFDSTGGVCAVENSQGYDISSATSFGMWVFGDNSGNELDLIFSSPSGGPEKIVTMDTVNWYGYKYIGLWRSTSDASTSIFKGFLVRSLRSAIMDSGSINVDDIQVNGRVTGTKGSIAFVPASFRLFQNYPNPFNPTTVISYQLPAVSRVRLNVYDVLGRRVATLVDKYQNPGEYGVTFDASRLPSGVYFYRLNAGSFTATKKMVTVE